jgi:hypothetical protein
MSRERPSSSRDGVAYTNTRIADPWICREIEFATPHARRQACRVDRADPPCEGRSAAGYSEGVVLVAPGTATGSTANGACAEPPARAAAGRRRFLSYFLPALTREWQNHEKELELKASLPTEMPQRTADRPTYSGSAAVRAMPRNVEAEPTLPGCDD